MPAEAADSAPAPGSTLRGKRILLIISGGIAAYKSLLLIRLLTARGAQLRCILTRAGTEFVTPLSVQALTGEKVYQDLFSLTDEQEMGHIALSRSADLIVVCPASADILAKMAAGLADDLATTLLLATDTPVLAAPAMNVRMWQHPATVSNIATLRGRGIMFAEPEEGPMACGEFGPGRLAEPETVLSAIQTALASQSEAQSAPLAGRHVIVTAGPTHEPIDPVRYIANRSSGRQGYAIAEALARLGARVTLVSGPADLPDPPGIRTLRVETACEMEAAVRAALPADAAVCAAAVADWRVAHAADLKIKKKEGSAPPALNLVPNPDILASISAPGPDRPALVIGFAAETDHVIAHATAKRARKGCDWIVANDVGPGTNVMGGRENRVIVISESGADSWPLMAKTEVARRLAHSIAEHLTGSA
ncbi:bifunctional phosphopantothenoylcysteine decarboxylase/phosphopantothenate--cysteine ligase CoaBC [Acetobacter sp. AN02]|uniref:bifunctional phosphopantothenoylcysteine decarboxylase/phosphopantothenate--cysteine ligase CoaBC n=1 Tax=Acetobacter sp. AN02 TaxID=2894186 RepID=UPI002434319A|nr:bifunctional phosphopantothenoylcysteine decarboxylase/phosphopantothenate--cysteine ligase CoaBC [Acetobacter sp. AN02]MDG6095050.1 bifunctional phosphopantothenoylcysteine decarboxylase/phosphopantothenate--cysteine ligase CoaBC [Acetobacter sp. AN02]